jgi:beta-phosphoglucomutase-like phosphatase (HAD superfamily)
MKIHNFKTLVFDCDGVILNSNKLKTQAFYTTASTYGEQAAKALVDYHISKGGISRYDKFEYFLKQILGKPVFDEKELKVLLYNYADEVWRGLNSCEVAEGIEALRDKTADSRWLVVSGGDQAEVILTSVTWPAFLMAAYSAARITKI